MWKHVIGSPAQGIMKEERDFRDRNRKDEIAEMSITYFSGCGWCIE